MTRPRLVILGVAALAILAAAWGTSRHRCISAWFRYGVDVPQCPAGEVHVVLRENASGLRRGQKGFVSLNAEMLYVVGNAVDVRRAPVAITEATVELVRDGKVVKPLPLEGKNLPARGRILLPADLGDGDYLLRAHAKTKAGEATVDAPLPVYAPARVHLLTDRPLYQPGQTVKFRAVVLRSRDLVPLDGRPGRFRVLDPSGTVVLDEKADAGDFGIAAGELPLDKDAQNGVWHVRWESGSASDDVPVEVKPFTLPRFTVDVAAAKPFYRKNDQPRVDVHVAYASGVPAQAALDVEWSTSGAWPAPPEWMAAFPKTARTDKSGHAELTLPRVPADLMGKAYVTATVRARDDSGDAQVGQGTILLAEDAIDVQIVTEFGDHQQLVDGVNNRAWLRATTAAGVPLPNVSLVVKRAWDDTDKGTRVDTDEDGVAVLQLDPGPPVNVLVPAMPVRLPPPPPPVERTSLTDAWNDDPPLADVAAIDRWNPLVARCARFGRSGTPVDVVARVDAAGKVVRTSAAGDDGRCIAAALAGQRLPPGRPRLYDLVYTLDPPLATLDASEVGGAELPAAVKPVLDHGLLDARECLGRMTTSARLPHMLVWELVGGRAFDADFEADAGDGPVLDDARVRCVENKLADFARARRIAGVPPPDDDADDKDDAGHAQFGALRLTVEPVALPPEAERPEPTTMLGYELAISAKAGDEVIGDTKLRVQPGAVPPIRLRASEVIAAPGDTVGVEILRGPDFRGELPKKLVLASTERSIEADVDAKTRTARFQLPKDHDGWYEAHFGGGVARVFVPKQATLTVDVTPDKRVYRPGERAKLAVKTSEHGAGVKAAVGLFGVDATLAALAPLPGPDAMERLAPTVGMEHKAFQELDATALALGRVRGKNAAAATVLLVSGTPTPDDLDVTVSANATTSFDPVLPLADRFYTVLDALYRETRAFEKSAPKAQKITPQKMLSLWDKALDDAAKKGPVTDAFGRRLELRLLPDDLIALTDPRLVVADGTRLPEDVEAWVPFVKRSSR